jgi:cell division protein FtsB
VPRLHKPVQQQDLTLVLLVVVLVVDQQEARLSQQEARLDRTPRHNNIWKRHITLV